MHFSKHIPYFQMCIRDSYYVLNDADYEKMEVGLGDEWTEHQVLFNIDGEDNYEFADKLFHVFMDALGEKYAILSLIHIFSMFPPYLCTIS